MAKLLCVKCERELYPKRNGVHVVETFDVASDRPYKLWMADLWACPVCGIEVVAGFGKTNYAEHYEPNFKEMLSKADPLFVDKGR